MSENKLQLGIEDNDPQVIYALGDLDYQNCEAFLDLIKSTIAADMPRLDLALGGLSFVDSCGLRVLINAANDANAAGCKLRIISLAPQLNHMLDIAGFKQLFDISLRKNKAGVRIIKYPLTEGEHEFHVTAAVDASHIARLEVCDFAGRLGAGQPVLDDIRMAVGEAVSNAIRHGRCLDGDIEFVCRAESKLLEIVITYQSLPFDPQSIPIPDASKPSEGGLGIHFMNIVMDSVNYDFCDGNVILTLEKRLHK